MKVWLLMAAATLAPVLLSCLIWLLDRKTGFGKITGWRRQIGIGLLFGALACLDTQFGIPYDGFVMNVRSAAPLTAGLVFGGPAGILAGVIGALYRWFSAYWGVPTYTRVACTAATVLAGVLAALCRKYMFGNKKAIWFYGAFIAMATEVFHMLLIFLTHMDDIRTAFSVVRQVAVPMIAANTVSLLLTLLLAALLFKERTVGPKKGRPITSTFALYLLAAILVSFLATSAFSRFLQNNVSEMEVKHLLSMNVADVKADVRAAIDRDLLSRTAAIREKYLNDSPSRSDLDAVKALLEGYCVDYNVTEVNLFNSAGMIWASTVDRFIGFRMPRGGGQSSEFRCLLDGKAEIFVQDYRPIDDDPSVYRKYAGMTLSDGGFIQVGYDFEHFHDSIRGALANAATNRHIGQSGFVFIYSEEDGEVISAPEGTVTSEEIRQVSAKLAENPTDSVQIYQPPEGERSFYWQSDVEGYTVIGCIPESEAEFSRDMSVYISALMQLVVFFTLFIVVFFLIKNLIVNNIHKINRALAKITGGDLSTRVDVRENEEFASLSNDINTTVERLKEFIADAERRVDMELAFAKTIQHSVLPSVFPPYPDRTDFDIYASMDTAKEVGGDFYDFELLDDGRLMFLVADVSGKGIPAAMFMMNAKSVIKSMVESGMGVADAFTAANEKLCAANEAEMFVTAWMGILDLQTGDLKFANAGHNPPLVRHGDGSFEYLKARSGLVLAGMEGIRYRENETVLREGDEIFLYTDGVTEATNAETQLFGEERLLAVLNAGNFASAKEVCEAVKSALDAFVGDAPQFDDITMLSLRYRTGGKDGSERMKKELSVPAAIENLDAVTDFVDGELEAVDCPQKVVMQMNIIIDELFSNIAHYAYPNEAGDAVIGVTVDESSVTITFADKGIPFNPLDRKDPDVTESAEDRPIGGLGIFMVKKMADEVGYEYRDGSNILSITKRWG